MLILNKKSPIFYFFLKVNAMQFVEVDSNLKFSIFSFFCKIKPIGEVIYLLLLVVCSVPG